MALEQEIAVFNKNLPEWLKDHSGEFVLIKDSEKPLFFDSEEIAYETGLSLWGEVPMLIKRVQLDGGEESSLAMMCGVLHVSE